jgi:outer membrane protein assembly factor BamB
MRAALLAVSALLAGCGITDKVTDYLGTGKDNAEPPSPLVQFEPTLHIAELWETRIGSGTDEQYLKLVPAIANQRIYVVDADGELTALDATNGRELWTADADMRITGGPGVGENSVLIGSGEGDVLAYDAATGEEQWHSRVSSEILSAPIRSEGVVAVRTNDGKLFGLDGNTGKRLWIYDRTVPSLTLRGTSAPLAAGGAVVAGFDAGKLAALELRSGRLLWETSVATSRGRSELERMVDIDSEPMIVDGIIYVATFQGQLAAIHPDGGRILWNREVSSYAGLAADDNYIYISTDDSHVVAMDRSTGSTAWRQEKLHARQITGPAAIGDYLVVGDLEGYLHWMEKSTGRFVARNSLTEGRIIVQPTAIGKILYAYAIDGTLAAFTYR